MKCKSCGKEIEPNNVVLLLNELCLECYKAKMVKKGDKKC